MNLNIDLINIKQIIIIFFIIISTWYFYHVELPFNQESKITIVFMFKLYFLYLNEIYNTGQNVIIF